MTQAKRREWTVLLYTMADQNRLRRFANETLLDIARASSGAKVKTVAQVTFHSSVVHPIRRYDFEQSESPERLTDVQNKLQFVPCKNLDPRRDLVDFLKWGQSHYPAKRYCVVLQGHAWGADYTMPSLKLTHEKQDQGQRTDYHLILGSPRSKNHLSNRDLQGALTSAFSPGKIDLLGMDSCLMCMTEVCYELHRCAEFVVAPEGLGPIHGWPFYPILTRLKQQPAMGSAALGAMVLDKYSRKYRDWGGDVKLTVSLCSLRHAGELMRAMRTFAAALQKALPVAATRAAIVHARLRCAYFRIPTYVDLHNFCRLLKHELPAPRQQPLFRACSEVETALKGRFVERVALKRGRADAFGLSIYFPKWRIGGKKRALKWVALPWTDPMATPNTLDEGVAKIDVAYTDHEFAEESGWKAFLVVFLKARQIP